MPVVLVPGLLCTVAGNPPVTLLAGARTQSSPGTNTTGIYRSTDWGTTWDALTADNSTGVPLNNIGRVQLWSNEEFGDQTIYMALPNDTDGMLRGVYESTDNGANWALLG